MRLLKLHGRKSSMEKYTYEEIKEQVEQGLENILRDNDNSADVCDFEMSSDWDGEKIFEFVVEIEGETFQLQDYMSDFDFYDLLTINCSHILDEMAEDIAKYVAEQLGVEEE